jgi:PadR family transcriptional regulator AphA
MNTLSFGLLCILATDSYTGYELMLKIQPFWHAKHSQIYPLLAALEKDGMVQYIEVAQSDKPDKKIYSITDKGLIALKEWIAQSSAEPVLRDEMMLKSYCISIVDIPVIQTLFNDRERMYNEKLMIYKTYLDNLNRMMADKQEKLDIHCVRFGFYIILKKAISTTEANIEWCKWVKELI